MGWWDKWSFPAGHICENLLGNQPEKILAVCTYRKRWVSEAQHGWDCRGWGRISLLPQKYRVLVREISRMNSLWHNKKYSSHGRALKIMPSIRRSEKAASLCLLWVTSWLKTRLFDRDISPPVSPPHYPSSHEYNGKIPQAKYRRAGHGVSSGWAGP